MTVLTAIFRLESQRIRHRTECTLLYVVSMSYMAIFFVLGKRQTTDYTSSSFPVNFQSNHFRVIVLECVRYHNNIE